MQPIFVTSGDMQADRRYDIARHYWDRGDLAAAADVMAQAVELAPRFASAWFALGEIRDEMGACEDAIAAFRRARDADVEDRHGAALHLARLGAEPMAEMPPAYVRTLFDQYAPRFDKALLETLNYRGPRVLRDAVKAALRAHGGAAQFGLALDLGCGTGLAARAFAPWTQLIAGCDLSPRMIEEARQRGLYSRLAVADMLAFLRDEGEVSADLVIAADAYVYVADLAPLIAQTARVLRAGGVTAFTLEAHEGCGVVLGEGLRYRHADVTVRSWLDAAGLEVLTLAPASTRDEAGVPVSGLVAVARKPLDPRAASA
jgi:predicted TPR repeat methyltransferase